MAPTKSEIESIINAIENGDGSGFWGRVAPDVNWTIMGTGPGAGTYTSLAELSANTIGKLVQFVDGPMKFKVRNILFAGGTVEWTTAELQSNGRTKNGGLCPQKSFVSLSRWNEVRHMLVRLKK